MALAASSRVSAPRTARVVVRQGRTLRPVIRASAVAGEVPSMDKRNTMNLILLGGIGLNVAALGIPYAVFFVPKM
jgi:hypothetical protein